MTRIIFVRHGQTEWNVLGKFQGQTDVKLTPLGLKQAQKAAAWLADEKIAAVYASDLERSMHTAACIAALHNLKVQPLKQVREIFFGDWEGMRYDEIEKRWPKEIKQLFHEAGKLRIPHGETFQAVIDRAIPAIDTLAKQHQNKTIVLVSHGAALRSILGYYMHIPLDYIWSIRQDNTAINRLFFGDDGRVIVELLNSTVHLKELQT